MLQLNIDFRCIHNISLNYSGLGCVMIFSFKKGANMSPQQLHKIIAANFIQTVSVKASMIFGTHGLVLADTTPNGEAEELSYFSPSFRDGDQVKIASKIAWDNRGPKLRRYSGLEALEKFCKDGGVEAIPRKAGAVFFEAVTDKFPIMNSFRIEGEFIVKDSELFNQKVREGIGSRRSYGFGLILATKGYTGGN